MLDPLHKQGGPYLKVVMPRTWAQLHAANYLITWINTPICNALLQQAQQWLVGCSTMLMAGNAQHCFKRLQLVDCINCGDMER